MNWPPFVSRARYEDLAASHRELKEVHERLLDEVNFRSTGFHLFKRFDIKGESQAVTGEVVPKPAKEAEPEQIGSPREFLKRVESNNMLKVAEHQKTERTLMEIAARKLNDTMEEADKAAQGAD